MARAVPYTGDLPFSRLTPKARPFPQKAQSLRGWLAIVFLINVAILFGVSGGLLWNFGINYDGLAGGAAAKVHPSTYLTFLIFILSAFQAGNPIAYVVKSSKTCPASLFLFICSAFMLGHSLIRDAGGLSSTIDTFFAPVLLVMLLSRLEEQDMRRLEIVIHVLMSVNAMMGIAEFLTNVRPFQYRFDGEIFPFDTRSSALMGHPLANASQTACYVLALLTGARMLTSYQKLLLITLQIAALVTFGGRTAMVCVIVLGGLHLMGEGYHLIRRGQVSLRGCIVFMSMLTLVPMILVVLNASGFFDALIARFVDDGGSANARVEIFELIKQIPLRDLLTGPDPTFVDSIRRIQGLEWGIENPILRLAVYQGIIVTSLMTLAVVLFLFEVSKNLSRGIWMTMVAFFILSMTAETLGAKTTLLSKYVVTIFVLYRPFMAMRRSKHHVSPSALSMAGSNLRVPSSMRANPSNRFQKAHGKPYASASSRTSRI